MAEFTQFPIPTKQLSNLQAIARRTFDTEISVLPGDLASVMPFDFDTSTFGDMLTIAGTGSARAFVTKNAHPLNLIYRIRLDSAEINTTRIINMGLRRGNESIPIPGTLQAASIQRAPEYTIESVIGVQGATFTSGPGDPYNNVGFVPLIYNTSDRELTIPLGAAVRIDFFAVAVASNTATATG